MLTATRRRGRPLRPPGASIRLTAFTPETEPLRYALGTREPLYAATILSGIGMRLCEPPRGHEIRLLPRTLAALTAGLYDAHRGFEFPVEASMSLAWDGLRAEGRAVEGEPTVAVSWRHSQELLLIGDELLQLAAVAALAADFATEWSALPDLEYWCWEMSQIPGVELIDGGTGIALPRHKPRTRSQRVAA